MNIGITLGDPTGIGPEVTLKALQMLAPNSPHHFTCYAMPTPLTYSTYPNVTWRHIPDGRPGQSAYEAIKTATADALAGNIDALVTAPINKDNLAAANIPYTGHTTMLQALTDSPDVSMAFASPTLNTILTTIHIPLIDVPNHLEKNLPKAARHARAFATQLEISSPKIAVAGLNPHASENGLFGSEETDIIIPFIKNWNTTNTTQLSGPFPPDTLYHHAHNGDWDIVISLYHDQGLIPIKLLAFDKAVNVTIGLPFLRTSPDHGTALDIAYQNKANPSAMINAITYAITHGT